MDFINSLEMLTNEFILLSAYVLEICGVVIILFHSLHIFWDFIRKPVKDEGRYVRLTLARRLALGLEFKLAAEILRTVVVRSLEEVFILGSVVALRGILSLIIHWEIKNMETEEE